VHVIASRDEAHDWLSSEMQWVCAGVDHATTVLTSLSYHGTAVVDSCFTHWLRKCISVAAGVRMQ